MLFEPGSASDLARAMAYAWHHDLKLVVDDSRFLYRTHEGWTDYFDRPWADEVPSDPARVRIRFEFDPLGRDRQPVRRLQRFSTPEIHIAGARIAHGTALRLFHRLAFQPNPATRKSLERIRNQLALPERYHAIHIRRGDKIGDEDVYYAASAYLDSLRELRPDDAIFVMTDEHASVSLSG